MRRLPDDKASAIASATDGRSAMCSTLASSYVSATERPHCVVPAPVGVLRDFGEAERPRSCGLAAERAIEKLSRAGNTERPARAYARSCATEGCVVSGVMLMSKVCPMPDGIPARGRRCEDARI